MLCVFTFQKKKEGGLQTAKDKIDYVSGEGKKCGTKKKLGRHLRMDIIIGIVSQFTRSNRSGKGEKVFMYIIRLKEM